MSRRANVWLLALVLVAVAGSVGFAAGSAPWGQYQGYSIVKVIVDGREVSSDVPAVIIDGRTMVPLRLVAESMGRKIEWDQDQFAAKVTNVNGRPERQPLIDWQIPAFEARIRETLTFLKDKAPDRYKAVIENVDLIVAGTGNAALLRNNTVTISSKYFEAYSLTWLANILVHEAKHIELFRSGSPLARDAVSDEREAFKVSKEFLVEVGAPESEIKTVEGYVENPPVAK